MKKKNKMVNVCIMCEKGKAKKYRVSELCLQIYMDLTDLERLYNNLKPIKGWTDYWNWEK